MHLAKQDHHVWVPALSNKVFSFHFLPPLYSYFLSLIRANVQAPFLSAVISTSQFLNLSVSLLHPPRLNKPLWSHPQFERDTPVHWSSSPPCDIPKLVSFSIIPQIPKCTLLVLVCIVLCKEDSAFIHWESIVLAVVFGFHLWLTGVFLTWSPTAS